MDTAVGWAQLWGDIAVGWLQLWDGTVWDVTALGWAQLQNGTAVGWAQLWDGYSTQMAQLRDGTALEWAQHWDGYSCGMAQVNPLSLPPQPQKLPSGNPGDSQEALMQVVQSCTAQLCTAPRCCVHNWSSCSVPGRLPSSSSDTGNTH